MELTICWLYDDLMNTYGDRGNVLILLHRLKARGIGAKVMRFSLETNYRELKKADLLLMGGAEDRQQAIVAADLSGDKEKVLKDKIEADTPGLFICGAYQFLGRYYETAKQERLRCLDIAPIYTNNPGNKKSRLIGETVVKITHPTLLSSKSFEREKDTYLIGFENHGGRTYLDRITDSLGESLVGAGNNGEDHREGLMFRQIVGTYLHGPILPRNPALADYFIEKALSIKYNQAVSLKKIDDAVESQNRQHLLHSLHVKV